MKEKIKFKFGDKVNDRKYNGVVIDEELWYQHGKRVIAVAWDTVSKKNYVYFPDISKLKRGWLK